MSSGQVDLPAIPPAQVRHRHALTHQPLGRRLADSLERLRKPGQPVRPLRVDGPLPGEVQPVREGQIVEEVEQRAAGLGRGVR